MEARIYSSTVEESAIIEHVARIVSSVRTAKPDYTRLAAELEGAIPFDVFGVVLLRHDRQAVRIAICQREKGIWRASHHQHPLEGSKFQQLLLTPPLDGLLVSHYATGLDGLPASSGDALSRYHQLHSTLIVPLAVEDRVLGTLELGSVLGETYASPTLQRLVKAVVRVLAAAIDSAQVGGRAELQDRQREALKAVSSSLASKMELSAILDQIVSGIARALSVSAAIFLFDRREQQLSLQAQCGLNEIVLRKMLGSGLVANATSIIGRTLQLRQPHVSQDISIDERFPGSESAFSILGMRSVSCYPLVTGPTIYGVLLLCSPEPGGYTPLKTEILALFADQATIAIHNGLLIESAHQRSHFQQAIERLDQARPQDSVQEQSRVSEAEQQHEELALLKQVREATQSTFGVSFTSLMRFISDYLLTRDERDLQSILSIYQNEQLFGISDQQPVPVDPPDLSNPAAQTIDPFDSTLALLMQTAEEALERAGMLGELSRLLAQLQQSTNWVRDAWFVVDVNGDCFYMNSAAAALCDLHLPSHNMPIYPSRMPGLSRRWETAVPIMNTFEKLYPRMRNLEEIHAYLQDFTQGCMYRQEFRCILAAEASDMVLQSEKSYMPLSIGSGATDDHYQFIRYPLYNRQGHLEANALQVRDITQQVRNEHNVSTLLSSVSHDLRTPLTTIKAAVTGLLQRDVDWSEQDRYAMLEDIDGETDHLTVLVHSLIELSRIEMGALTLSREWCDVVEVWYGAWQKLERIATGCSVHMQAQGHLPLIYVDHAQLERVFYNMVENALRRSSQQVPIEVFIDAIESEEKLRIRMIDRGKPIPDAVRNNLFVSFQNLRTYGNGLGLAICKGIIHAHQGQIWAESNPDNSAEGACFVFTLPTYKYTIERTRESATALPGNGLSWRGEVSPVYHTTGDA